MRNTRQGGPTRSEGGDASTTQQHVEIITALQETVAATRDEQVQRQDQFRTELDASRAANEELRRANEELRRNWQRVGVPAAGDQYPPVHNRARTMPFSQEILDTVVPKNMMTPKITFTGAEDSNVHLPAFQAQTMI